MPSAPVMALIAEVMGSVKEDTVKDTRCRGEQQARVRSWSRLSRTREAEIKRGVCRQTDGPTERERVGERDREK